METEASNLKHSPLWPLSEGVIMNTAHMHSSGVIQPRHYTRKNMNTVVGGDYVFILPRFQGKVRNGSRGARILFGVSRKKNQSLITIC